MISFLKSTPMKTKVYCLSVLFIFLFAGLLPAREVPVDVAKRVAVNFYSERNFKYPPSKVKEFQFTNSSTVKRGAENLFYLFDVSGDAGFVIVSADDLVRPVIGYSFEGHYNLENPPPALAQFMRNMEDQVAYVISQGIAPEAKVALDWDRYGSPDFLPDRNIMDVGPLITVNWDQGCYYNEMCPTDYTATGNCYHALTGCGATAMAQIMKYYSYPSQGTGEHGYDHATYGYIYANFGASTYDYSSMPASVTSSNAEVAKLIFQCGVAQDMDYGPTSSGSYATAIDAAFKAYFDYSADAQWKLLQDYTLAAWQTMLRAELDASRPVLYRGADANNNNGHFFNCDGYQGTDYFHINWGWSGNSNGYFLIDNLAPGSYNFSYYQMAIFNLHPNQAPPPLNPVMDFEAIPDFSLTFDPWTVSDMDGDSTYGIQNHVFLHNYEPYAYIAFNPAHVTPAMTDAAIQPHAGARFGACFSATTPPNNDWFISPKFLASNNTVFSFWVKSYTGDYGLERYNVAVSTTNNNPSSFTIISGSTPLLAPLAWTQKTFSLAAYNNQQIYVAIQCVSSDAFIFMIDDLAVTTGSTPALTADFTADQTNITVGSSINFTDQSTGNPTTWTWSFPGGTPSTSTLQNPSNILYNTTGTYDVSLTVTNGSSSNTKTVAGYITVGGAVAPSYWAEDFESLSDFTLDFSPAFVNDADGDSTYGIQNHVFLHNYEPFAYIAFNPAQVVPSMASDAALQPHSGQRFGACFSSSMGANNDWFITPRIQLKSSGQFSIWVKSYTSQYGLEKYNVGISTTNTNPGSFTLLNGTTALEAPTGWTKKTFDLSAYNNQTVYAGIQCVSSDAFIFMIDDVSITGSVGIEKDADNSGISIYPVPARDEIYINFARQDVKDPHLSLFNNVGTCVARMDAAGITTGQIKFRLPLLPGGIYYLEIKDESGTAIRKVVIQ
jgi:PKD repeat protein